jgi:hypothetical protein
MGSSAWQPWIRTWPAIISLPQQRIEPGSNLRMSEGGKVLIRGQASSAEHWLAGEALGAILVRVAGCKEQRRNDQQPQSCTQK